jgi:hypothetical protein
MNRYPTIETTNNFYRETSIIEALVDENTQQEEIRLHEYHSSPMVKIKNPLDGIA